MDNQHDPFLDPSPPPRVASWRETAAGILALAPALFIGQLGWVGMKVTDTALLGHVGTHALAAASLSDLWTMASGVLIQGRVLGIFVGNAVGAAKAGTAPWQLAGEWLQVSVAVLGAISCFVMGLWAATGPVLRLTRADAALIPDASYFSLVLLACIPARVLFSQLQQYLSAQRIVKPAAAVALVGLAANLLLGYLLVLGVPTGPSRFGGYGFPACPIVTSAVEWLQLLALAGLFCLCLGYGRQGWPQAVGWCGVSPAFVTKSRVREYLKLYVPAALSIASDFWRMSAVGAFAASLSTLDLAVFTASYRVMWISLVLTGSLTGGVGIKVAQALGASRPHDARRCVVAGLGLACVALAAVAALILAAPRPLAAIFSSDASVLDAFVRARLGPCLAAEARSPEITERTRDRPRLGSASPQSR
uniref:Uncharacterized protein n=1 Tax=Emiliania huxleyi TaxID=2903 RepID=A0A7S3SW53_EMIHU